jgi:hypothetical protein
MARNELHFFDKYPRSEDLETYRLMMKYSFPDQVTIEKTPYWVAPDAPRRIHEMNPHIKLLLVVREPACRMVSDYFQRVRNDKMVSSVPLNDVATNLRYAKILTALRKNSLYDIHMQNWLTTFPPQQILIIRNEDLRTSRVPYVLHEVEDFLGLKHELMVDFSGPENHQQACINGTIVYAPTRDFPDLCFDIDERGACKYEEEFGPLLKDFRNYLKPHVSNFEKIVDRKFKWFN